jgi:competence protein ComEA
MKLYIPIKGEVLPLSRSAELQSGFPVNINTADMITLMQLPGIGESKAAQIISYREAYNGFSSIEELMNVTGIGESIYSQLKSLITVD